MPHIYLVDVTLKNKLNIGKLNKFEAVNHSVFAVLTILWKHIAPSKINIGLLKLMLNLAVGSVVGRGQVFNRL